VRPRKDSPPADILSLVVALGKQLSSVHHPLENLLTYCDAAGRLCPRLRSIHIAFFSPRETLPVRVFLFLEKPPGRLLRLGPADLSPREKRCFRDFSLRTRKVPPVRRGAGSKETGAAVWVDAFFRGGGPGLEATKVPGSASGRESGAKREGLSTDDPLPLSLPGGPEGWVFFSGAGGGVPWEGEERNAVGLCTDMLCASLERAALFARVLRAKKEWERSMDAIRDVVMIVGPDYTVLRGNRRLSELAGVPLESLQGEKCHRLLTSRRQPCPNCPVEATFRTGADRTAEVSQPPGDALVQVWSYPLRDPSAGPQAVVVYEKDVTEIKRMQAKLLQAEKMAVLGELAAAVAHELNNPLSGVISFSKILLTEMDPALPYAEDVQNIEHAALRCKKIVQDLLAFARKPGNVTHEPVQLETIVEQVHGMLRPGLEEKGVRMSRRIPANVPDLPFHPDLLHQLLVNLIVNARDASAPGDEITVRAAAGVREHVPHVVISVQDRGHGIPPAVRDRIFDPFFSTKGPGEGTGLGLSICRKLMDAFGGDIEVSSSLSRGTTVSLWFPVSGRVG